METWRVGGDLIVGSQKSGGKKPKANKQGKGKF